MPNIICEELIMTKDGKVDIVEREASKFWNEKIQRLEEENKKLTKENEDFKAFVSILKARKNAKESIIKKLLSENQEQQQEIKKLKEENFDIHCDNQNLQEEIASRKSLCDHFEMLNKEHYDELQRVKKKSMRSISKLAREKKDLKKLISSSLHHMPSMEEEIKELKAKLDDACEMLNNLDYTLDDNGTWCEN